MHLSHFDAQEQKVKKKMESSPFGTSGGKVVWWGVVSGRRKKRRRNKTTGRPWRGGEGGAGSGVVGGVTG